MAISSNAINVGSSISAQTPFQARTPGSAASQIADDQKTDSEQGCAAPNQAGDGSTGSGSQSAAAAGAGPSAQTRNRQAAQSGSNARATRARGNATAASGSSTSTDAADCADGTTADFGTVMANALGGADSSAAAQPSQSKTATDSGAAAGGTNNATDPQTAAPPTDAVAWIAQMMPGAAHAAAAAAPAAQGALAAGQSAASATGAIRARINGNALTADSAAATDESDPQAAGSSADTTTAATATATATAATPDMTGGNLNALADVQKLISGLTDTGADSDSDTGTVTGTPASHTTAPVSGADASGMAAAAQAASLSRPNAGLGTTTLSIQSPVGSAAFADEVSSRVTGLAQSGITQAQLQLNPTDLGPVQVHITMQSGQASVWFGATHADTRAALEQSLPRLREMFAGAGMPLTDSGVFREPPQQQQARSAPGLGGPTAASGDTATATTVTQVSHVRLSLLDTYA